MAISAFVLASTLSSILFLEMNPLIWIFVLFCTVWAQRCNENIEAAYHIQSIMSGNLEMRSILDTISVLSKKHRSAKISKLVEDSLYSEVYEGDFWDNLATANDISRFRSAYKVIKHMIEVGKGIASAAHENIMSLKKLQALDFIKNCLDLSSLTFGSLKN